MSVCLVDCVRMFMDVHALIFLLYPIVFMSVYFCVKCLCLCLPTIFTRLGKGMKETNLKRALANNDASCFFK